MVKVELIFMFDKRPRLLNVLWFTFSKGEENIFERKLSNKNTLGVVTQQDDLCIVI